MAEPPGPPEFEEPYQALFAYQLPDTGYAPTGESLHAVVIQQWSRAAWDASMAERHAAEWDAQTCAITSDVPLNDGSATIYRGIGDPVAIYETPVSVAPDACPAQKLTRIEAVVTFADAVLLIRTPGDSSYRSLVGMETILAGLHLR